MPKGRQAVVETLEEGPMELEEIYEEIGDKHSLGEIYWTLQRMQTGDAAEYDRETEKYKLL